MSKEILQKVLPHSPGEKMLALGVMVDAGIVAFLETLRLLQSKDVTHLSPENISLLKNVAFYGAHITGSYILKIGGIVRMLYFEEENWLHPKRKIR